jgi:hypothetical protein
MSRTRRPPAPGPRGRAETPAKGPPATAPGRAPEETPGETPGEPPREPQRDDPVARAILELLDTVPPGRSISPVAAARAFALTRAHPGDPPDAWRRYLPAVRQQALHLARAQRIAILRKGKPVDPHAPFKGVVRLGRVGER